MDTALIYGLVDPVTSKVCYVGHTKDIEHRIVQHWYNRNRYKNSNPRFADWLNGFSKKNKPDYFIFESVPYADRFKAENYYTNILRASGIDLFNIISGNSRYGELNCNFRGKALSPETRSRISAKLIGNANAKRS